jgi:DNA (cytosine-5)-methyltransferase 1
MGFDARWGVLGAADVGANHQRDRIWIVAKWSGQVSHSMHNRIRRWEQQQESLKKEVDVSNSSEIREQWKRGIQTDRCSGGINGQNNAQISEEPGQMARISDMANASMPRCQTFRQEYRKTHSVRQTNAPSAHSRCWWDVEPNVGRVADGVAARVDRLKAIGNGQVPLCAATAWRILSE